MAGKSQISILQALHIKVVYLPYLWLIQCLNLTFIAADFISNLVVALYKLFCTHESCVNDSYWRKLHKNT